MTKMILPKGVRLFVDSDGVFAHFDQNVEARFGYHPDNMNDDKMWELITANKDVFWTEMPVIPGAEELWAFLIQFNPTVLTGVNKSHYEEAAAMKRIWWEKHFGHADVITCLAKDKILHMANPGDILIDDFARNTKRWEKAGGVAIVHTDNASTIAQLTAMLVPEEETGSRFD